MVGDDAKRCLGCGETKPLTAYYVNKAGVAGRQSRCKSCFRKQLNATPDIKQKKRAREAVRLAIKAGELVRPETCSACGGRGRIHGHHDDYARELDVRWLCAACHEDVHRGDTYKARS